MRFAVVLLIALSEFSSAVRVEEDTMLDASEVAEAAVDVERVNTSSVASAEEHQLRQEKFQGTVLNGRYVLKELLLARGGPGEEFPVIAQFREHTFEHTAMGEFGDYWKAVDDETGAMKTVKIFYEKGNYVAWQGASKQTKYLLNRHAEECTTLQTIAAAAESMDEPVKGYVQHICQCLEAHVLGSYVEPAFLVLEFCGLSMYGLALAPSRVTNKQPTNPKGARMIIRDVIKAIRYLQSFTPAYVHHYLKPDSIFVSEGGAKLVFDGGLIQATAANVDLEPPKVAMSALYSPPEFAVRGEACDPTYPYAYDMFAAGLMYVELLCPLVPEDKIKGMQGRKKYRNTPSAFPGMSCTKFCPYLSDVDNSQKDFALIDGMINADSKKRTDPAAAEAAMVEILSE